jgi:ribonuclease G
LKWRWRLKYGFGIRVTPNQSVPLLAYAFYDAKGEEIDMREELQ